MGKTEILVEGLAFAEGPRWRDGKLWFSDMHDRKVMTVDLEGRTELVVEVPELPSGLGWTPDGTLLIVSMIDRRVLKFDGGALSVHAELGAFADFHCNDMVVDASGRCYVGNFGFDLDAGDEARGTNLILVQPDGTASVASPDMMFPNGAVIAPDGSTLIVGETFGACLTAFDIAGDGTLSNRRVWAALEGSVPDGICLDAEGAIWVSSPISNEFLRVKQGGEVTDRIDVGRMAIACMLGGDDGRTLFCLTSESTHHEKSRELMSARIETCRVEVPGAGLP